MAQGVVAGVYLIHPFPSPSLLLPSEEAEAGLRVVEEVVDHRRLPLQPTYQEDHHQNRVFGEGHSSLVVAA